MQKNIQSLRISKETINNDLEREFIQQVEKEIDSLKTTGQLQKIKEKKYNLPSKTVTFFW